MDYASEEEQGGDPPRIWAPGANFPGTAFTRSLGDSGELRAVVDRAAMACCAYALLWALLLRALALCLWLSLPPLLSLSLISMSCPMSHVFGSGPGRAAAPCPMCADTQH